MGSGDLEADEEEGGCYECPRVLCGPPSLTASGIHPPLLLSQRNSDFRLSPLLYLMQPMDLGGGGPPDQEGLDQSKTEKGRILSRALQLWFRRRVACSQPWRQLAGGP